MGKLSCLNLSLSLALLAGGGTRAQAQMMVTSPSAGSFFQIKGQAQAAAFSNAQIAAQNQALAAATMNPAAPVQPSPWNSMLAGLAAMFGNANGKKASDTAPSGNIYGPSGENYIEQAPLQRTKLQEAQDLLWNSSGTRAKDAKGDYRIYRVGFREKFDECTKEVGIGTDCQFQNWGIEGDSGHAARRSCHNAGEAIDVGPITCGSTKYTPKDPKFQAMIRCFAEDKQDRFQVITSVMTAGGNIMHDGSGQHAGHMHIQLKFCNMIAGKFIGESGLPPMRGPNARR